MICPSSGSFLFVLFMDLFICPLYGSYELSLIEIFYPATHLTGLPLTRVVNTSYSVFCSSFAINIQHIWRQPLIQFFLVSEMMPRYLDTHNAISAVAGHKIDNSFSSELKLWKFGINDDILPKKQLRFKVNVLQSKIAWLSSSILFSVQYLQILESTGVTGRV